MSDGGDGGEDAKVSERREAVRALTQPEYAGARGWGMYMMG